MFFDGTFSSAERDAYLHSAYKKCCNFKQLSSNEKAAVEQSLKHGDANQRQLAEEIMIRR